MRGEGEGGERERERGKRERGERERAVGEKCWRFVRGKRGFVGVYWRASKSTRGNGKWMSWNKYALIDNILQR